MKLSRNKIIKIKKKKHQSFKNNKKKYNKINKKKKKKTFSKKNKKRNFNVRYNTVKKKRKKTRGGTGIMRNFLSKSKDQTKEQSQLKDSENIFDNFKQINDLIQKIMNIKLETDVNSITKSPTQMHVSYYRQKDYENEYRSVITRDKIFFDPINGRIFFTETYLYFNFYSTNDDYEEDTNNNIASRLRELLNFQNENINSTQNLLSIIYPEKLLTKDGDVKGFASLDNASRILLAKDKIKRREKLSSNQSRLSLIGLQTVGNKRQSGGMYGLKNMFSRNEEGEEEEEEESEEEEEEERRAVQEERRAVQEERRAVREEEEEGDKKQGNNKDLVGKKNIWNLYGRRKSKEQKEAEAKAVEKFEEDLGIDDVEKYKKIAKLVNANIKRKKKACKKKENIRPGGCCNTPYGNAPCLPFQFARIISMKKVLERINTKDTRKPEINKEKFRDVVAASRDKQLFLQRCRELVDKLEKKWGISSVSARSLVSVKKLIRKNFKTDNEELVKEILVHYLIKTPFVDEKIISIKLSPYTFAITKDNKDNVNNNNLYSFDTGILNTNTLNNNQIDEGEVNPDAIKNVNINLMYTNFIQFNQLSKNIEQIKSENIEYGNKLLNYQVDFDKNFAKKTKINKTLVSEELDDTRNKTGSLFGKFSKNKKNVGAVDNMTGGAENRVANENNDENKGSAGPDNNVATEDNVANKDNVATESSAATEGNVATENNSAQDNASANHDKILAKYERILAEKQNKTSMDVINTIEEEVEYQNPILERINEDIGNLEFSLRSIINPEVKDKYFDIGDTEKDMSFVKTKKNISIFVEYKKNSMDGGAAGEEGANTEPENAQPENAQPENDKPDETADFEKPDTKINKNGWQKGLVIGLTGTTTFKIKNLQTSETIDINVDDEEYETNIYYPFTSWFFPYINFTDSSIKFSVASIKRYAFSNFYAQKSKKELDNLRPENILVDSNHWFSLTQFGKEMVDGPEYVEAAKLKLANIPRQIPTYTNQNDPTKIINMLSRHDKTEYETLLKNNPMESNFKKFIKNYVKAIDNRVSKVGKEFSNDGAIKEILDLKNIYKKCGQEVCGEEDIKKLAVLANQLRNKVDNKVIDLNNNDIKIIYICDLRGRIYKLSQVKNLALEDIKKYDNSRNIIQKKLNELIDNGADQTSQDGDFLMDIKKEYRIILENFKKSNPEQYALLGKDGISIENLNKTIKQDNYDNAKLKQTQDQQIEAKKLKKSLNDIHKDGKGDMDIVRKSLEVFLESALKKTNLSRGSTFSQSLINLTSFLARSGKECDKMWKEYKKIYNSKDKGKEELTRLKDEFLRENKENIFKCVETNRMGDIFHLLDNHYDYIRDSVDKSKNEQQDTQASEEVASAIAEAKASGDAAALTAAEAKKEALELKKTLTDKTEYIYSIGPDENDKKKIFEFIEEETKDGKKMLRLMKPLNPDEDEDEDGGDEEGGFDEGEEEEFDEDEEEEEEEEDDYKGIGGSAETSQDDQMIKKAKDAYDFYKEIPKYDNDGYPEIYIGDQLIEINDKPIKSIQDLNTFKGSDEFKKDIKLKFLRLKDSKSFTEIRVGQIEEYDDEDDSDSDSDDNDSDNDFDNLKNRVDDLEKQIEKASFNNNQQQTDSPTHEAMTELAKKEAEEAKAQQERLAKEKAEEAKAQQERLAKEKADAAEAAKVKEEQKNSKGPVVEAADAKATTDSQAGAEAAAAENATTDSQAQEGRETDAEAAAAAAAKPPKTEVEIGLSVGQKVKKTKLKDVGNLVIAANRVKKKNREKLIDEINIILDKYETKAKISQEAEKKEKNKLIEYINQYIENIESDLKVTNEGQSDFNSDLKMLKKLKEIMGKQITPLVTNINNSIKKIHKGKIDKLISENPKNPRTEISNDTNKKNHLNNYVNDYLEAVNNILDTTKKDNSSVKLDFKDDLELLENLKKYQAALDSKLIEIGSTISSIEMYNKPKTGGKKTKKRKKNKQKNKSKKKN